MKKKYVFPLFFLLFGVDSNNFAQQKFTEKNLLIQGFWIDVKDAKNKIKLKNGQWISYYGKEEIDIGKYSFYHGSLDTIEYVGGPDTLIYQITYLNESSLDLNYLGSISDKSSWGYNNSSYRKITPKKH